jgi:hypothetical protein
MTLKQYLFTMIFASILCWIAWAFVIVNIDPFQANLASFAFFYITLFFALIGSISLILFEFYRFFSRIPQPMFRYVEKSFKNALFVSTVIVVLLFLKGEELLNIWNFTIFLLVVALSGSFVFSKKNNVNLVE